MNSGRDRDDIADVLRGRSRERGGRLKINAETRALIRGLANENQDWERPKSMENF